MTNSQFKKLKAKKFNALRIESLAYAMDKVLFPKPKVKGSLNIAYLLALSSMAVHCE